MQKNLQIWQAILGLVISLVTSAAVAWNFAVAKGKNDEKIEMTQKQHGDRIIKLEVNAEIDRKENREQYNRIMESIFSIQIMMKDKEDRK